MCHIPPKKILLVFVFLSLIFGCAKNESRDANQPETISTTRPYYLGFTPWPYEASLSAQTTVYNFINENGDMIAHHFQ